MAETPDQDALAADIAGQANAHIREMAMELDALVPDRRPIGFFCECGCMGIATVTLTEYDVQGGAWIEGHEPAK